MGFKIGDAVFDRSGQPSVVVKQDPESKNFVINKENEKVKEFHRHGYINGLNPSEKSNYVKIMDDLRTSDPKEKMLSLQERIAELKADPSQHKMIGYLEAELFHVMNTHGVKPKTYEVPELG